MGDMPCASALVYAQALLSFLFQVNPGMNVNQFHDELRDTFNRDYRLLLISNYMRLMGESWEAAQIAVDRVLMGERDK